MFIININPSSAMVNATFRIPGIRLGFPIGVRDVYMVNTVELITVCHNNQITNAAPCEGLGFKIHSPLLTQWLMDWILK